MKTNVYIHKLSLSRSVIGICFLCLAMMIVFFGLVISPALAQSPVTDQSITDAIEDELLRDDAVPHYFIDVQTTDGIVTLSGSVDNILAKERAAAIAAVVKGVRSIVNHIQVDPPVARKDNEIRKDVNQALLSDPATDSYEINVEVQNGTVTLSGEVDSWQEKQLSANVAKGVRGVKKINNELSVNWTDERTDAEIKAEIEKTLRWDAYIDHELINVTVDNGAVILTGTVGSLAEKNRAFWDAFVHGVISVDDSDLTVERWARDPDLRGEKFVIKSDAEIEKAIEDALFYDPRVLSFKITAEVDNSVATLRGTVDNLKAKRAAAGDARNTVGVRDVVNRIKVRPVDVPSDSEIEKNALEALARDPYIESYEIAVDVQNGVADLYGTVDNYFEKSQADDIVSKIEGVLYVDNNLLVSHDDDSYFYDPYVDDWYLYDFDWYNYQPLYSAGKSDFRIEMDINDELFWSPFVDADEVDVEVNDGKAILTGTVDTWLEYDAAEDNAYEGGAVIVDNELAVKP